MVIAMFTHVDLQERLHRVSPVADQDWLVGWAE